MWPGHVQLDELFVQRIPEAIAERRRLDAVALARVGVEQAADEPLLLHALLEIRNNRFRIDVRRQRQAAHAAERVRVQLHLLGDDVVGFLDEPFDQPRVLAGHHLIRPGRDELQVGADLLQLREVRAAAEHRRVQRLPDIVVIGQVAAAAVCAAMRKYLSLIHIQAVWRCHVSVRIDDHPSLPSPWRPNSINFGGAMLRRGDEQPRCTPTRGARQAVRLEY